MNICLSLLIARQTNIFFAQSYAPVHALSTISNVTQYASGYIQFIIMLWNNTIWAVHNFLGIIPCMTYERI